MELAFYIAGGVAVLSTILMVTRPHVVHALLYLIVSLLGVAVVFYLLGASFVAALEVIVYAGAIMVLFIFVVMMLNLGAQAIEMEKRWLTPGIWVGPVVLACILIIEVLYMVRGSSTGLAPGGGRAEASWYCAVWTLPDWRGTCFHAPAGRTCWRVPPELPQSRKKGDSR